MALQETTKFANKEEYKNYLIGLFEVVSENQEYNIFLHCVTNYSRYFVEKIGNEEEIQMKVEGILKNGLNLEGTQGFGGYGSINGTARFIGSSTDFVNIDKIADYDYFSVSKTVSTIVITIPKYVVIKDESVEFSSLNGTMENPTQHTKACLFDVVKGMFLPVEFILGYQTVNKEDGSISFYQNPKHLAKLSKIEQKEFMEKLSKKCEEKLKYCRVRYGTESLEEIFEIMTQEHMTLIDEYLNQP